MGMFDSMEIFQRSPDIKETGRWEKSIEKEGVKNPNEIFALAKREVESVIIRPEDRNLEGRLLASPGGPESNLSEEYWKLVRTPSFREWFNDSDVVDENGEPALLFHTTDSDLSMFDSFSKEKGDEIRAKSDRRNVVEDGHYFTDSGYHYGENKVSVFLKSHVKKVETQTDIANLSIERKRLLKKVGYNGLMFQFEDMAREIKNLKEQHQRTFDPYTIKDKIFFGINKGINKILGSPLDFEYKKQKSLQEIEDNVGILNKFKVNNDARFFAVAVFDSDQIMIVKKEENYKEIQS